MMAWISAWAALGLAVAMPLNHLADRLPLHRTTWERPACRQCGRPYGPGQWPGFLAVITGANRCLGCGAPLPARRLLCEVFLALLFGALAWRYPFTWAVVPAAFHAAVLTLIAVSDLEHHIVPNAAVLPAMAVTLLLSLPVGPRHIVDVLLGGAAAFAVFLLLWRIYPRGMGMGDVKLAGYIGLLAGYPRVWVCLLIAVLAGGVGAAGLLLSGRAGWRSYIAYAPYLVLAGGLALFLR